VVHLIEMAKRTDNPSYSWFRDLNVNQTNFEMLPKASSRIYLDVLFDKRRKLYSICNAMKKSNSANLTTQHCWKNIVCIVCKGISLDAFSDQNKQNFMELFRSFTDR
jgi:hypothetical protein